MFVTQAVLTGDLVRSSDEPPQAVQTAMDIIRQTGEALGGRFDRFRGDGWQLFLPNGGKALLALLLIFAALRKSDAVDTRISIGLAPQEDLPTQDLSAASGPAFVLSGRGLDRMHRSRKTAIDLSGSQIGPLLQSQINLVEEVISRWSREQAEAILLTMETTPHRTSSEVAERLGISRQAVSYRLTAASYTALAYAAEAFEQVIQVGDRHD